MGQCNGKACTTCRTNEAAERVVRKAQANVTLMVAHKAIHDCGEDPWRCRLCEEMGRHTESGIVSHLRVRHKIQPRTLIIDRSDGSMFTPCEDTPEKPEEDCLDTTGYEATLLQERPGA